MMNNVLLLVYSAGCTWRNIDRYWERHTSTLCISLIYKLPFVYDLSSLDVIIPSPSIFNTKNVCIYIINDKNKNIIWNLKTGTIKRF